MEGLVFVFQTKQDQITFSIVTFLPLDADAENIPFYFCPPAITVGPLLVSICLKLSLGLRGTSLCARLEGPLQSFAILMTTGQKVH